MRAVFVCDNFADSFIGGAELSLQTHIDTSPVPIEKVKAADFIPKKFNPKKDFLIFGNFIYLKHEYLPEIPRRGFKYVVEECDYKYCRHRSSHRHKFFEQRDCDCHATDFGRMMWDFMSCSRWLFWKSERQRGEYVRLFGDVEIGSHRWGTVVGGVFSDADIDYILSLKGQEKDDRYFVLRSQSWLKATTQSLDYCRKRGFKYFEVGGVPYKESLKIMAKCKGVVYMPRGFDVSCRMITEAKLLGLEIHTNDLVQHVTEKWFNGTDEERVAFLRSRNPEFWRIVTGLMG